MHDAFGMKIKSIQNSRFSCITLVAGNALAAERLKVCVLPLLVEIARPDRHRFT
jgi:hypothetical protein